MKSYTNLEQSKKLAKILPLESADMVYLGIHQGMDGKYHLSGTNTEDDVVPIYKNFFIKVFAKTTSSDVINQLPCWSLAVLLDILPNNENISTNLSKGGYRISTLEYTNSWFVEYEDETDCLNNYVASADNPVDACIEMIMHLNKLNLL